MNRRVAYVNGLWEPEDGASLSIFDSALATGDVVVEVLRTFGGRLYRASHHWDRMSVGLAELRLDPGMTMAELGSLADEALARNQPTEPSDVDWQVLVYVSRGVEGVFALYPSNRLGPTVVIACFPLVGRMARMATTYGSGVDLVIPWQPAIPARLLPPQIKSRGRVDFKLAKLQATSMMPGASALLVDPDGHVTESTGTNVFVVTNERLTTAPAADVVNGVTRGAVLDIAAGLGIDVVAKKLPLKDVRAADEMFLSSTVIGMVHVRSLDDDLIRDGCCGPVTERLRAAFHHEVGVDVVSQARAWAEQVDRIP